MLGRRGVRLPGTGHITNDDDIIASVDLQNALFNMDLKIMFKYGDHRSPELNFCYYAASTVMSDICTNPFKIARGANTLEELNDGMVRLIAKLNRVINKDDIKLYLKKNVGNPGRVSDVAIAYDGSQVSVLFDPGPRLLSRTYFFEFGDYKSPNFLLKSTALFELGLMQAEFFGVAGEETTEEGGSIAEAESGTGVEVAEDADLDLTDVSVKSAGHCSLVADAASSGMSILAIIFGAAMAPLAVVRVGWRK